MKKGEGMDFLQMNPLTMKLNSKATSKNIHEITCGDSFLAEKGLRDKSSMISKGEEIKDYV